MTRTGAGVLVLAAVLGAAAGFVLDHVLTMMGRPTFTPSISLPLMLVVLGGITLVLALPVRRAIRGTASAALNPFRALRIAILAKASSIVGASVAGVAVGLGAYLLTRPVAPPIGSLGAIIGTAVCAVALVVTALIAESFCILPKDDDDEHAGSGAGPGTAPSL